MTKQEETALNKYFHKEKYNIARGWDGDLKAGYGKFSCGEFELPLPEEAIFQIYGTTDYDEAFPGSY